VIPYIVYIFALLAAGLVLLLAILGLRKKFFSEGYAGLWFLIANGLFLIILLPDQIKHLSVILGFQLNTSFLFLCGIITLLIISMIQSIHISQLRIKVKNLAQAIACQERFELENKNRKKI
jgi:hypothetical protein